MKLTALKYFKQAFASKAVGSLAVRVVGVSISFLLAITLARILTPDGYGTYTYSLSLLNLLAIPLIAGLPQLSVRETAKAKLNDDWVTIASSRLHAFRFILIYSIIVFALIAAAFFFDLNLLTEQRKAVFIVGVVSIPLTGLFMLNSAVVRGLKKIFQGLLPELIVRPAMLLLIIGLMLLLNIKEMVTPQITMVGYVAAVAISYLVSITILRNYTLKKLNVRKVGIDKALWTKSAISLSLIGGLQLLNNYSDVIIIGIFHDDQEVGIYRAMSQISMIIVIGLTAINQKLHPEISQLFYNGSREKLQSLINKSWIMINLLALIPASIFLIFGSFVSETIFGLEYVTDTGTLSLSIMSIGLLLNTFFGSVGALLNMTGNEKDSLKGLGISMVINLVLSFGLIPEFGMLGAAIANAVSMVMWNIILRYYVSKRLKIESIGLVRIIKNIFI